MRSKVVSKLNAFDPLTKRQQSAALQMGKCWPRRGWTGGENGPPDQTDHGQAIFHRFCFSFFGHSHFRVNYASHCCHS